MAIDGLNFNAGLPGDLKMQPQTRQKEESKELPEEKQKPERAAMSAYDEYIPGPKAERVTGSTDKVDREIERLKRRRDDLARQISAETDETKIGDLQRKLAQVEQELRQKDNDAYRRSHMEVTAGQRQI